MKNTILENDTRRAKTKTDAACGYRLDPSASKGNYYDFDYHITKNGSVIIDRIEKEYKQRAKLCIVNQLLTNQTAAAL